MSPGRTKSASLIRTGEAGRGGVARARLREDWLTRPGLDSHGLHRKLGSRWSP